MTPTPQSAAWSWSGTKFVRCKTVPLTDRGFRYGMSVFESIRVRGGEPEFFDRHLTRLIGACGEREFAVDQRALEAAERVLGKTGIDGLARVYVTGGDGSPDSIGSAPRIFVFVEAREPAAIESYELTLCDESYRAPFGGLKTGNYWFNAEALSQARRRKFDEALLFNDFAELVSACMANVFVVREDRIMTPSRSCGARAGVIRDWVIARRKVEERRLRREDVVNADEIFLTNSWIGVMPVATVEGRPLGH